jgi:hypothetical protein
MSRHPIRDTGCGSTRFVSHAITQCREVNTLSHNCVDATVLRSAVASGRTIRCVTPLLVVTIILFALVGCSDSTRPSTPPTATATATTLLHRQQMPASDPAKPRLAFDPAQWRLSSDPAHLADELVADEQALRDPSSEARSHARESRRRCSKPTTAMSTRVASSLR